MKKVLGALLIFIGLVMAVSGLTLGSSKHYLEPSSDERELVSCGSAWSPRSGDLDSEGTLTTLGRSNCAWTMAGYGAAAAVVLVLGLGLMVLGSIAIVVGATVDNRAERQIILLGNIDARLSAAAPDDASSGVDGSETPAVNPEAVTGPVPTVSGP